MRAFVAAVIAIPLLAGCLSGVDTPTDPFEAADILVPEGATLAAIPDGFAVSWSAVQLPFRSNVTLPAQATIVRAAADAGEVPSLGLVNAQTGRRRCNNPTVESFSQALQDERTCSGVTAIDGEGAIWQVRALGTGTANVRVEFLARPLDGLLAGIDLGQVDPPVLPLQATQFLSVPSWDGTPLRVEVTLPEGEGPWPVIISSSPYNDDGLRMTPAMWLYWTQDWAKRGYAAVNADVRGFGDSGGCVEVWGVNEQKDQAFLVDWAAQQAWSNGRVGFYGQSYVGTTPVEAAVQAPEGLKAIISVAPVINAYEDWHYGGVPNGESTGSPVAYQVLTEATTTALLAGDPMMPRNDPMVLATTASNGVCDPSLAARANDPRAVYDAFYEERDFKLLAGQVKAAVLYTQGFEDANVKSSMIPGWFNELQGPKLGVFGHWLHQHPPRLDSEALMVAWIEHYVKGKDLGLESLPKATILESKGNYRNADQWPPVDGPVTTLWPDFAAGTLGTAPAEGSVQVSLDGLGLGGSVSEGLLGASEVRLEAALTEPLSLAGEATVHVEGTLTGAGTAYVRATLLDVDAQGDAQLFAWGGFNVAHNADHTQYSSRTANERLSFDLPLRPTEHVFRQGHSLVLYLDAYPAGQADPVGSTSAQFTFDGGPEGTRLVLPGVDLADYAPAPFTFLP